MLKIIDLLTGETVIPELDKEFIETEFLQHIAAEYAEDLPEFFWLSPEALEGLLSEQGPEFEEDEELTSVEPDDTVDAPEEIYFVDKTLGKEMKKVLKSLMEYLSRNSEFIDSNDNDLLDPNERGCYLAFEYVEENPEYKVHGRINKGGTNIPGLRVQLYDNEFINDDFIGFGFTDPEGYYEIEFNREHFSKDPLDFKGIPNLYVIISEFNKEEAEFRELQKISVIQSNENITEFNIAL